MAKKYKIKDFNFPIERVQFIFAREKGRYMTEAEVNHMKKVIEKEMDIEKDICWMMIQDEIPNMCELKARGEL